MKIAYTTASVFVAWMAWCVIQMWHWPIKASADWRPQWWQFETWVQPGYHIAKPAFFGAEKLGAVFPSLGIASFWIFFLIELAIAFALISWIIRKVMIRSLNK